MNEDPELATQPHELAELKRELFHYQQTQGNPADRKEFGRTMVEIGQKIWVLDGLKQMNMSEERQYFDLLAALASLQKRIDAIEKRLMRW